MLISLILSACSDQVIKYPVPVEDTAYSNDTPVAGETDGTYDTSEDEPVEEDTGYEEPIDEEEDVIEDTDYEDDVEEPAEDTAEEVVEEPEDEPVEEDEPEEIEEEEIIEEEVVEEEEEEEPVITTVDNFNYDDSYVIHNSFMSMNVHTVYASDMGWDMIAQSGANICGILPSGYIDCSCQDQWDGWVANCDVSNLNAVTPFETFVDMAMVDDALCASRADGTITCYHEDETTYTPPTTDSIDIVALSVGSDNTANTVCSLESSGYLFCFDTVTGGMVHSDSNTYKVIEGAGGWVCGVHDTGDETTCHYLGSTYNSVNFNWSNAYEEIIGFDSGKSSYCATFIDFNGMQVVECAHLPTYNNNYNCFTSAPHQYYYDFFTNDVDLSNVKVTPSGGSGMVLADYWHPSYGDEIWWGGYSASYGTKASNNGYYTGSGCNYYWGN